MELTTLPPTQQEQKHSGTARNFFLYFLQFVLLYVVAIAFGGALFAFINKYIPQAASMRYSGSFNAEALRYTLATLIIASPVFLWLARKIFRDEQTDTAMIHSGIRRWLTYITLIAAALISIGDLINLVFNLLGGEITARFILKALTVLFIAGSIFFYFLLDVKSNRQKADGGSTASKLPQSYFMGASALILIVIIIGFFNIGSPLEQRAKKQDEQRIMYLQNIQYTVEQHATNYVKLPENLNAISIREDQIQDPVTKAPFRYEPTGTTSYRLCAIFETSNKTSNADEPLYYDNSWLHGEGEVCFDRNINYILQKNVPAPLPVK